MEASRCAPSFLTPLPPDPPLVIEGGLQQALFDAALALGRLDGAAAQLPDRDLLIYASIRKEAVLSSRIEGTQSSISDLMLFELDEAPGVPLDDVREVSNYVAAMDHGLRRLREGFPSVEPADSRDSRSPAVERAGQRQDAGGVSPLAELDRGQPPGQRHLRSAAAYRSWRHCMGDLERFLHADDDGMPALVRAALAHVQFETIHPFLDGNGRVGRLLITFLLCHADVLRDPILYLSLYLKEHRSAYYELLDRVRRTGDWEAWLAFFLQGVRETADGVVSTSERLSQMFAEDRGRIESTRRAGSALRVHHELMARPILSIPNVSKRTGLSFPAAASAMGLLVDLGIAREITGRKRNRIYAYDRYLAVLNEGTEA